MAAKLDKLAKLLPPEKKKVTQELFNEKDMKNSWLNRKGSYPYAWMDSIEKMYYEGLPPKECFYNDLTQEHISDEEYQTAWDIFNHYGFTTFKDYHMHYLKLDVCLIADVCENLRDLSLEKYGIDPF